VLSLLLSLSLFAVVSYFVLRICYSATQPQVCNKTQCQCQCYVVQL